MDVVICATNTNIELFDGSQLVPGQHVTGIIGSNKQLVRGGFLKKARREIDDATAVKADVIVTNLKESMVSEEQGGFVWPYRAGAYRYRRGFRTGRFLYWQTSWKNFN